MNSTTNETHIFSKTGMRTKSLLSSPAGHSVKPRSKLPNSTRNSIEVASKGLGNKDYLDFLANKTPILPLLALKHKLDKRPAEKLKTIKEKENDKIDTTDFQIDLLHDRTNRKFKDNHPLLANVNNDAEKTV
jgi:hypothetical protein